METKPVETTMALLFGTDGVRARVNTGPMTAEALVRLGLAAGRWSIENSSLRGSVRPTVVLGKDTRLSGYMVEAALVAGFTSMGLDCRLLGPIPTPGVAHLTRSLRAEIGVMISASHNPHQDNGVKLFGPDGFKLSDANAAEISALASGSIELADAPKMGRARRMLDSVGRYVEFAKRSLSRQMRLDGLKIVVDCANGAAYRTAPDTLYELGAEVVPLGVTPNGFNINEGCGAVHPETMASAVVANGADAGMSLDGDADRIIMADETGTIIDGDQIIGCLALAMKRNGTLNGDAVVGTVMSNRGLERRLSEVGITLHRTGVGDRYIMEKLSADGYVLGGEPSGHILLPTLARAGDGLLAGLQMLALLKESGEVASKLFRSFVPNPLRLENLYGLDPVILQDIGLQKDIKAIEAELNGRGRVVVRPSGTENLVRVMVEADTDDLLTSTMDALILRIQQSE